MPEFNRFDICEAYLAIEQDYNLGGWLPERPSNKRRMQSTDVQLHRIKFRPAAHWNGYPSLSENARAIYHVLEARYGFASNRCRKCLGTGFRDNRNPRITNQACRVCRGSGEAKARSN